MTIEAQYGVPTVAVHTDKFDRVVRSVAAVNGMSELRQVFVPQPVMGKSPAELRAYVDNKRAEFALSAGWSPEELCRRYAEVY